MVETSKDQNVKAQYDHAAKMLLANKNVLARILIGTVDEFHDMDPDEVKGLIEGEPQVGTVPISPGETNTKIRGMNTENHETGEGTIVYDVLFQVRMRDGLSQMIINVEAQKDNPSSYPILNRAIFYDARLISSQKEREFSHSQYGRIKPTSSIWICMNQKQNSITKYELCPKYMANHVDWPGDMNIFSIFIIGIQNDSLDSEQNKLLDFLDIIFSDKYSLEDKERMLLEKHLFQLTPGIRKEMNVMCNLAEGIEEKGKKAGEDRLSALINILLSEKRMDLISLATTDSKKRNELYKEYGI